MTIGIRGAMQAMSKWATFSMVAAVLAFASPARAQTAGGGATNTAPTSTNPGGSGTTEATAPQFTRIEDLQGLACGADSLHGIVNTSISSGGGISLVCVWPSLPVDISSTPDWSAPQPAQTKITGNIVLHNPTDQNMHINSPILTFTVVSNNFPNISSVSPLSFALPAGATHTIPFQAGIMSNGNVSVRFNASQVVDATGGTYPLGYSLVVHPQ
ncbi:MAG: hypothetical protein JST92_16325 [Deltaproteobacteria bacterium]|nr:hypothetical protein [Deltaproteobacteria bacterium]